jgi:class 3 adenylate cyclase/tetratricopeptide (TPR) repeat protein
VAIGGHRKVVTVLFCDVVDSTALGESVDAETLQGVLARYFERMKGIVESHGGTVDKFIGDAVMAVFGVPLAHEDDALRACRAAVEMRELLPELGMEGRIGVNTGEVLAGTEERLATGDALNVAARLEQAAAPGEVLIGSGTLALVRAAVEVGEQQLLELKGKKEPVAAYALGAVREAERAHASRFVGREQELGQLVEAWDRTLAGHRCELVTVVGDPGVGKSRLVAEALARIEARAVRGRCLSYGEGITYWPVVEVVKQLDALPSDEQAANAVRSLLRQSDTAAGTDEIAWAFRKLLEEQAPLVVCFDDIQWGEKTFLDLVESTALLSTGVSLLLVCMARPELLDGRPGWPAILRLEPLQEEEANALVGEAVPAEVRERIVRASGGNPLFLTEMVMLAGDRAEVEVPPTLRALLAARLDQLEEPERRLLELGSVEGELFHRGAVQALAPEETEVTPWLAALVRHELVRPDQPQVPREDAYRFRHILIRDAAYDAIPKARRVVLHERFAAWLEEHGTGLVELDELVGHHLEQAVRYQQELGRPLDEPLAAEGCRRLTAAGRRAFARQDNVAAASLLERAAALVPAGELDAILEFELLDALLGVDGERALQRAGALAERAAAMSDPIGELCWRLEEGTVRSWLEREGAAERLAAMVEQALPVFEAAGDDLALCVAYRALGRVADTRGQVDTMGEAGEHAAVHAQRVGLSERQVGRYGSIRRARGAIPASELLAWLDEQDEHDLRVRAGRAWVLAMLGRIEEAQALLVALRAEEAERGGVLLLGAIGEVGFEVEFLAGDPAAAAAAGEELCRRLEGAGSRDLEAFAGRLAQAYYQLGRLDEADAWAARADELGTSDDAYTQMLWRQARAKLLARRGDHPEAERLIREAVAISDRTEMLDAQADAYADLAEVLSLAGRHQEAAQALEQALERFQRKQNLVMAERTRRRLEALANA